MGRIILGAFLLLAAPIAFANSLTGKVVKITDGDTLTILDANYKEHKIRLAGIDAPERKIEGIICRLGKDGFVIITVLNNVLWLPGQDIAGESGHALS